MEAKQEPVDPVDEELERLLQIHEVRESLEEYDRAVREGRPPETFSHNEARRIVGLPPLPDDDLRV